MSGFIVMAFPIVYPEQKPHNNKVCSFVLTESRQKEK